MAQVVYQIEKIVRKEYNGASDSISSGQAISISGIMCGAGSATSAVVGGGTSSGSYVSGQDAYEFGSGSWSSITNPRQSLFSSCFECWNFSK